MSGIVTGFCSPAAISGIVSSALIASPPWPTVTSTTTSVSVPSPWFTTWMSKAMSEVSGTVAGGARCERNSAERCRDEAVAVQSRRGGAAVGAANAGDLIGHEVGVDPLDVREEGKRRLGDLRVHVLLLEGGRGARLEAGDEQHVAREEDLHHLRDPAGAVAPLLLRQRARQLVGHLGESVAAEVQGLDEVVVRVGELVRHVEVAGPVRQRGRVGRAARSPGSRGSPTGPSSLGALRMSKSCLLSAWESFVSSLAPRT